MKDNINTEYVVTVPIQIAEEGVSLFKTDLSRMLHYRIS
jgi:hypothetical protein